MAKINQLILLFWLFLAPTFIFSSDNRGAFLWPSTFYEYRGVDKIIDTLHKNKITDVFLLVKGEAGATFFPSQYTYRDLYQKNYQSTTDTRKKERYLRLSEFLADSTLVEQFIQKAHAQKIRVHAWFMVSGDRYFIEQHPGAEVAHLQKPDVCEHPYPMIDNIHVNLAYPLYKDYFFSLVKKALQLPFDGLMLDKIRYTHLVYTWDNIHLSKARRAGVDINKVMDYAFRTVYGKEDDKELFIYSYRDGDKDIQEWIRIKKADVEAYVKQAAEIAREKKITFSAAFMPEGAYDENYADVYCAQNYRELSPYFDYIVIMAYARDFHQPATWVKMTVENAKVRSQCKIWAAIQGYGGVESDLVFEQVKNARVASADGIAVFRFGEMSPSMWKGFREAFQTDIKKIKASQIKGLVFTGGGTIRNCWLKSMEALLLSEKTTPFLLKENQLTDFSQFEDKKFILIPGGGGSSEAKALGESGLANIEKFVASGGSYLGICAGAYLPVEGYWGNLTEKLEIVNAKIVDVEHWNRGSGTVKLEIKKRHPIFAGIKDKTFELEYYSGPVLVPGDLPLPNYQELAVFRTDYHENSAKPGDMLGRTAILEASYKKGKVILFSPHPELTKGKEMMLVRAVEYLAGEK